MKQEYPLITPIYDCNKDTNGKCRLKLTGEPATCVFKPDDCRYWVKKEQIEGKPKLI